MATNFCKVASESGRIDACRPGTRLALPPCAALVVGACLVWSGCFEVVKRRPDAEKPWWENPGNRPQGEIVQEDTARGVAPGSPVDGGGATSAVASSGDSLPVNPAATEPAFAAGMDGPASTAEEPPSRGPGGATGGSEISGHWGPERDRELKSLHAARGRSQKENVERVNEYALWCIENGMWKEARFHLEKALAADSVSASLSNNLGVVYERLGEREKAELAYQRARALNPRREAYRTNLRRLQGRKSREILKDGEQVDSLATELEDLGLDAPDAPVGSGDDAGESGDPDGQIPGSEPESR